MKKKIRVGILINSIQIDVWKHEVIKDITESNFAEVVVFIKRENPKKISNIQKLWKFKGSIVYKLLDYFDLFLSKTITKKHPSAFTKIDYSNTDIPILLVIPKITKFCDEIIDEDLKQIQDLNLDVLVRFGFRILKGDILRSAAKFGVWSYHHGDNRINRGGPPGFWEVLTGSKETGAVLQKLSNELDGGLILARTTVATYKYNVNQNKNRIYWRASKLIVRELGILHSNVDDDYFKLKAFQNPLFDFYSGKLFKAPSNWEALLLTIKYFKILFRQIFRVSFFKDQWFLLVKTSKNNPITSFRKLTPLKSNKSIFWADPFLINQDNQNYIFIEEFDWKQKKGHISVIELLDNKQQKVTKIIDNKYHFSYPFIFKYENSYYMIPETAQNRTIELYKCIHFPYQWSLDRIIFENIVAVDTTLFYHNGFWWLFTCIDETQKATNNDELFLYYAKNPIADKWTPHKQNPVISDANIARPAGNIFKKDDRIFRPSQNCTGSYGSSININEILILDPLEYSEINIVNLKPDWNENLNGIHTLNFNDELTVIDGYIKSFKYF